MSSRKLRPLFVPAEVLWEIEKGLSEPLFAGVSIGSTLGYILTLELMQGLAQWDYFSLVMNWFRGRYHLYRRLPGSRPILRTNPILLTWIHARQSFRDLVLPVVKAIGPDRCQVVGGDPGMKTQLPPGTGFLTWSDVPNGDHSVWRKEYRRCATEWHKRLHSILNVHGLPKAIFYRLANVILAQSRRVIAYQKFLEQIEPAVVITEYDRNLYASCLILAARSLKIPTVTMMHGVINPPYGYTPLLADRVLCWGEQQKMQFIGLGEQADRLVVTGCQRLTRTNGAEPGTARKKVNLPPDRPLVMFASNTIYPEHRHILVRTFCMAFAGNHQVSAIVRLHPAEKIEFYQNEITSFPQVHFLGNDAWSLDEALAAADVVVCHDSGLGNDALVKGRLVVLLDVLPVEMRNGKQLADSAKAPVARSAEDLSSVVLRIFTDSSYNKELRAAAEQYVDFFCAAFGNDAARNVADFVIGISDRRVN